MQNLMQIRCFTHSVILNATATQYTCSLSGVYCPTDYDEVVIVHPGSFQSSPWLPGYIDVVQTVLIILTMAGLFLVRPHI